MTQQLVLIAPQATHTSDPITSYLAELEVTASGRRATHQALVLALVTRFPGLCAEQVGEQTGLGRTEAARRLSDAKNKGLARHTQAKDDGVRYGGTLQSKWYATGVSPVGVSGAVADNASPEAPTGVIAAAQKDDAASA